VQVENKYKKRYSKVQLNRADHFKKDIENKSIYDLLLMPKKKSQDEQIKKNLLICVVNYLNSHLLITPI
jgi:hypothetical protein